MTAKLKSPLIAAALLAALAPSAHAARLTRGSERVGPVLTLGVSGGGGTEELVRYKAGG